MKTFNTALILLLFGCQDKDRTYVSELLTYSNYDTINVINTQIQDLYKLNFYYPKNKFEITDNFIFNSNYPITGDLFDYVLENNFSEDKNDQYWNYHKKRSSVYYLGKIKSNTTIKSQIFLLKYNDPDDDFFIDKLILINSIKSSILSDIVLSYLFTSEFCMINSTQKNKNIFLVETRPCDRDDFDSLEEKQTLYATFKINNNGYIEELKK
jgi:hypothetical protein